MSGRQLGKTAIFKLFGSDGDQISALGALVALGKEYEIPHMRYEHLFDLEDGLHAGLSICSGSSSSSNSQQRAGLVLTRLTQGRSRSCGTRSDCLRVAAHPIDRVCQSRCGLLPGLGSCPPARNCSSSSSSSGKTKIESEVARIEKLKGKRKRASRRGGVVSSSLDSDGIGSDVLFVDKAPSE